MSKISGKGKKPFYFITAFVILLCVVLVEFTVHFIPRIYVQQAGAVPSGCISSTQAYRIAIRCIREYATENGRLILHIDIRFWNSARDLAGQRGDDSLFYPEWGVEAYFLTNPFDPWPIYGYSVLVWADTGEIRGKGAQGVM